jgi:hypothetical protein
VDNLKKRIFKYFPETERNILLTGDPDKELDSYTYIWIYTYPELAILNTAIQQNFQYILQSEDNFEPDNNNSLNQQNQQRRRGRPQGSRNLTERWKNTVASKWKSL